MSTFFFLFAHDFRVAFPNVWAVQVTLKLMVLRRRSCSFAPRRRRPWTARARANRSALMIAYTDSFRGTPLILVAFVIGFGLPGGTCERD